MKKLIFGVIALVASVLITVPARAATNDFTITSYSVNMTLGRDADRRSMLQVKETITADFPMTNQNHGLERAFVKDYDGHSLSFKLGSVTDQNGKGLTYHWTGDNLRIGDADKYVHGSQTYVISYSMRDVTKFYSDTGRDEFYWDVIGTEWQVPIQTASIALTIDPLLKGAFTGNTACYSGPFNSTTQCIVEQTDTGFMTTVHDLSSHEGVTTAIGFTKGTFAPYEQSIIQKLIAAWVIVQLIATPVAVLFLIIFLIRWSTRLNRTKEIGTIVAEYLPPNDASVTTAARIGSYTGSTMTAQMLDFAVRHYVKIYETKAKGVFKPAEYEIEVIRDPKELRAEEQELLKDTFGYLPEVGKRLNLKELKNSTEYYQRTLNNGSDLDKLIRGEYQLQEFDESMKAYARRWARIAIVIAVPLVSFMWVLVAIVLFAVSFSAWRTTDKGLALKRYLEGLKLYISVAEKDRIKMLQSPEGAEKVQSFVEGDPSADPKLLIKLYERVLPYAVLFGQEKEWNTQLGKYYETAGSQPDWYTGRTAFNAAVFSTAMSSFSTSASSASSFSSSSGGSSGGGFSGGGGGGGGGGGW